jgi:hypothetical protein
MVHLQSCNEAEILKNTRHYTANEIQTMRLFTKKKKVFFVQNVQVQHFCFYLQLCSLNVWMYICTATPRFGLSHPYLSPSLAQAGKLSELTPHQRAALYWPGIQVRGQPA